MLIVPGTAPEFNMAMNVLVPAVVLVTELDRFRMTFEVMFNGAPVALFVMPLITPVLAVVVGVWIPALLKGPPATPVVVIRPVRMLFRTALPTVLLLVVITPAAP